MTYYLGTISIIATAIIFRRLIDALFASPKEPEGLHSDRVIIGNGWGVYDGEYVEGRYDI